MVTLVRQNSNNEWVVAHAAEIARQCLSRPRSELVAQQKNSAPTKVDFVPSRRFKENRNNVKSIPAQAGMAKC
jgi:hypothetical protein